MLPLNRLSPHSSVPSADCPQSVSFMELSLSLKVSKMLLLQLLVVLFPFPSIQLVSSTHEGLLYPISSETRETISLDGIWKIRVANEFDPHEGFQDSWYSRSIDQNASVFEIPVPGNYPTAIPNWQRSTDGKEPFPSFHPGWIWYEREFSHPIHWKESKNRIFLRIGAAHYYSIVYLNGEKLAEHEGGSVPFTVELTSALKSSQSLLETRMGRLTIAVNSTLSPETIPQGRVGVWTSRKWDNYKRLHQTGVIRDYTTYAGLHGSVILYTTPLTFIEDINVTTTYDAGAGYVTYSVGVLRPASLSTWARNGRTETYEDSTPSCQYHVELIDREGKIVASSKEQTGVLTVPQPRLWWPYTIAPDDQVGYLYTLKVKLTDLETLDEDVYRLDVGIRTIKLAGNNFYINDKPFYFRGILQKECQKMRCTVPPDEVYLARLNVWDLNRYMATNSMRGLYYPLTEDIIRQADRHGVVIISEVPAVGLKYFGMALLNRHKEILRQLIQRDKNNPSVVIFNLANIPHDDVGAETANESSKYFRELTEFGRKLDPQQRPFAAIVKAESIRNSLAVNHVDIVGLSWHKTSDGPGGKGTVEFNQSSIVEQLIAWSKERTRGMRKPLLLVADYGVHPTQSWAGTCSSEGSYEREILDEFHANFDRIKSNNELALIGEMNWTCDNDHLNRWSFFNDQYFCRKIHDRYVQKAVVTQK